MPKVKIDWCVEGLQYALKNNDIVVIVDTLRFSSAVTTAVANGFVIYPISDKEKQDSRYSLSPQSFLQSSDGDKKVFLYSPNGATCAELVKGDNFGFIGCLLNAKAVGKHITELAKKTNRDITIIAAGEKRAVATGERIVYIKEDYTRVFAIEDYLACGAIISCVKLSKTVEAEVCELSFNVSKKKLKDLLLESFSGKYLVQTDRKEDVEFASRLNHYDVVPIIKDGVIETVKIGVNSG